MMIVMIIILILLYFEFNSTRSCKNIWILYTLRIRHIYVPGYEYPSHDTSVLPSEYPSSISALHSHYLLQTILKAYLYVYSICTTIVTLHVGRSMSAI